jgi:hypothetical protein
MLAARPALPTCPADVPCRRALLDLHRRLASSNLPRPFGAEPKPIYPVATTAHARPSAMAAPVRPGARDLGTGVAPPNRANEVSGWLYRHNISRSTPISHWKLLHYMLYTLAIC